MKLKGSVLIVFLMFCDIGFSQVKLIAHRGAKKYAPENTIPAFLKAKELGADFVEIDVRQTKDGILVAMHDATVDRTTNGTGAVKNLTWSEVQKLDATAEWKDEYSNIPVPSFRQVVQKTKGIINLDIDFKDGNLDSVIAILK
ncbi:MAG: glycerophosphodiester phosphodiesterase family protein, partial [Flavobacteriales bacterium]|nr:glycerophosphodiester phosphodiesterase family protein [Flavobacteriales bacterium]